MLTVTREPSKGGRPAQIDDCVKDAIVRMYNAGRSGREIAVVLAISKSSVYRILKERK